MRTLRSILLAALLSQAAAAAPVDVEIYRPAEVRNQLLMKSGLHLERILRYSQINVRWKLEGDLPTEARVLMQTSHQAEDVNRAACEAKRSISVLISPRAPEGIHSDVLGYSLPLATRGINVVVYYDRIVFKSSKTGVAQEILMAHALAHEIGHVLLRSSDHTEVLMKASWGADEYRKMRIGQLFLCSRDRDRILANISGSGCGVLRAGK